MGERALRQLRDIDKVAYVRFASVYRQFEDIDEFQQELARLELTGADRLPGEQPLPGIDASEDEFDTSLLNGPTAGRHHGGNEGHE